MPNPKLTKAQLLLANQLLGEVRQKLEALSENDPVLLFAYRRKVAKELIYDERGKPLHRAIIKRQKIVLQNGLCAECGQHLDLAYSELDRREATAGYNLDNTELLHAKCHHARQASKRYA